MCKKKCYLAGACESLTFEGRNEWREDAKNWFSKNTDRIIAINPVDYFDYSRTDHYSDYEVMQFDLRKVRESAVVLVNLKNIRKSVGTIIELHEAYKNNIPIIGVDSDLDYMVRTHPWLDCMIDRIEISFEKAYEYIKNYYEN